MKRMKGSPGFHCFFFVSVLFSSYGVFHLDQKVFVRLLGRSLKTGILLTHSTLLQHIPSSRMKGINQLMNTFLRKVLSSPFFFFCSYN